MKKKVPKGIYSRINYWIASKAFNVVNSFLARRARDLGYSTVSGYNLKHQSVIDWNDFEDMMLDIELEYEEEKDKQQRIKELNRRPYNPNAINKHEDYYLWRDMWICFIMFVILMYYISKWTFE